MKWTGLILFFVTLVACGEDDKVENPPQNTADTEQENPNVENLSSTTDTETDYIFVEFELELNYNNEDDDIMIHYKNDEDRMEASYVDETKDIDLAGDYAMEELHGTFTTFDFNKHTPDKVVISDVLEAFDITEDTEEVELEITFPDGTEKEYHQ